MFDLLAHDSEIHFVHFTKECVASRDKPSSKRVVYNGNPVLNGCFISDTCYVGCGFDNAPLVFKLGGDGNWKFEGSLDPGFDKRKGPEIQGDAFSGNTAFFNDAFSLQDDMIMKARDTKHKNYINCTQPYVTGPDGKV